MTDVSRRNFIKNSTLLGLSISFYVPSGMAKLKSKLLDISDNFIPNAFVNIAPDNTITLYMKHLEMGQGIYTGLSTIIAEELEVGLDQIKIESAPADAKKYNNTLWGPVQGTGGSTGIVNSYKQLREAGATAKHLLLQAAAKKWGVPTSQLKAVKGTIVNTKTKKSLKYGDLVSLAKTLPAPKKLTYKNKKSYNLIGKEVKRVDAKEKTNGTAQFSLDKRVKNRATAVIARSPLFGGVVVSYDSSNSKKISGVIGVYKVPMGVAVVAKDFWTAKKGREALKIKWDNSKAFKKSTSEIEKEYIALAKKPGKLVHKTGNPIKKELKNADKVIEATYVLPYLAHTPLEPLNCTMEFTKDGAEIWTGSQMQTIDQAAAAAILGLKPQNVKLNTMLAGGSFGRRATPTAEIVTETAHVLKAAKELKRPIHLVRTREEDIQGGFYRPLVVHQVKIGLDKDKKAQAWEHTIVSQSIVEGTPFAGMAKGGIDPTSVEGADESIYNVPHFSSELHSVKQGVSVLWWRSVGHTHTGLVVETMIDELAKTEGIDPIKYRLDRLGKHTNHKKVLEDVAKLSKWNSRKKTKGKGFGVAVHKSFRSYVAQVVEVTVNGSDIKVDKVYCSVDCGLAINPDIVKTQIEGGIGFGLSAALHEKISIKKGIVEQLNFDEYELLRMNEMPEVEVNILTTADSPTGGIGEPGVPPLFPALLNAIEDSTGKRIRRLPIDLG